MSDVARVKSDREISKRIIARSDMLFPAVVFLLSQLFILLVIMLCVGYYCVYGFLMCGSFCGVGIVCVGVYGFVVSWGCGFWVCLISLLTGWLCGVYCCFFKAVMFCKCRCVDMLRIERLLTE